MRAVICVGTPGRAGHAPREVTNSFTRAQPVPSLSLSLWAAAPPGPSARRR